MKKELAIALQYDHRCDAAPRVSSQGKGHRAREILRIARRHGVPIQVANSTAAALSAVDEATEIPAETYDLVARLLVDLRCIPID